MRVCRRDGGAFDLIGTEGETSTALVRDSGKVRITYNLNNTLTQLVKNDAAVTAIGTYLVADGATLRPTGDKRSSRTVARLLALPVAGTETKTLENGKLAYLLPVQIQ